ncbi:MAG: uroporphyrinogen decarboxylase family protein [Planctomycetota bacterium]|jgi:uroporphyrinogen decarboxylase|nr:uroporphyrinogen decarboxylase family protein [Planctomycetota bacterium]
MDSRERVLTTLNHEEPDRVPFNLRPSAEIQTRLQQEQNDPKIDFGEFFRHDVRYVGIPLPRCPEETPVTEWTPLPTDDAVRESAAEVVDLKERGLAVCSSYSCGVFEQAKHWFGDAETLLMPFDQPDRLEAELDRITEWKMAVYGAYAQAGVDIVWIGDDLGTQRSLVMSPDQYRQWYRPRHARIVDRLRQLRRDVKIAFHCCGYVTTLIPDLIDIGIDILEVIQPECMNIAELKREFGRDLSFWGAIGTQSVLTRTSREEVLEDIRNTLTIMVPGGGYIAAPCHGLTKEVSWETVMAFYDALNRFGSYTSPSVGRYD